MVGDSQEVVGAGVGGQSSGSKKTPTLEEYGSDLTSQVIRNLIKEYNIRLTYDVKYYKPIMLRNKIIIQASEGKLDPVVGRKKEIERVIQILGRRTKNNPCLVGYCRKYNLLNNTKIV